MFLLQETHSKEKDPEEEAIAQDESGEAESDRRLKTGLPSLRSHNDETEWKIGTLLGLPKLSPMSRN